MTCSRLDKIRSATWAALALAFAANAPAMAQPAQFQSDYLPFAPRANPPPGYPATYAATVRAAEDEGKLVVYSSTDTNVAEPVIADFRAMYPRVDVTYENLNTTVLYHRFVAEVSLGDESADVLWSSALDQQMALASKGYAMNYDSVEKPGLPDWAYWNNQVYATTYEPVVVAYNKDQIKEPPLTRADLVKLLDSDPSRFKGKVVTYDIEKSGVGFLLVTQDVDVSRDFWNVARAIGRSAPDLELTTAAMADKIVSGEALIGYNLLGGYVMAQASKKPSLGYVFPKDYTLVISRSMLANAKAAHPNAAKLWVDYILSRRGQTVIAEQARLAAIRTDVAGEGTAASLQKTLGATARPVKNGPGLIGYLNNKNYRDFILEWKQALGRP